MTSSNSQAGANADGGDETPVYPAKHRKNAPPVPLMLRILRLVFLSGGYIAPALTGRLACKLWYQTTRFPLPAYEKNALLDADVEIQEINGAGIASYAWGNTGPWVLLIHGWNGRATQLASFVKPLLKTGFRVLAFDAPAHGKSTGTRTTIYEIAGVIMELSRRYGPFQAAITHSFGGPSLMLAMKQGFPAAHIVCLCPPANAEGLVDKFAQTLRISDKSIEVMKQLIEQRFGSTVWSDVSMLNNVSEQTVPAMIIHDEDDTDVPWQEGHAVSQAWPGCRFVKTRGLGHHRILRDKENIKTVVDFIA
jgi:pimeloyl-ACP methyl ester carboxylesterase